MLSSDTPYQRQQTLLTVSINSSEPSSRLSINDDSNIKYFNSTPLKFQRVRNADGTYTLKISGRSNRLQIDRCILYKGIDDQAAKEKVFSINED